ncbi:Hypothetical predicted protein [Cloeon dipterum]|uniref:THAP-type domain-containing protein n=2 Tax=Cloeon dipterum TaxID=197152 RepID=A0A8S1C4B9_9INSE|nr:Hypothetical predicted protein [Cloeon dipterum]
MPGCVVPRCGKNSSQKNLDVRLGKRVSFHNLPSEPEIRERWVEAIRQGGRPDSWEPTPNAKICCLHFAVDDLVFNGNMTKIRRTAVPIIPYSPQKKSRKSRQRASDPLNTLIRDIGLTSEDMISLPQDAPAYSITIPAEGNTCGAQVMDVDVTQTSVVSKKVVVLPYQDHTFQEKFQGQQQENSELVKLQEKVLSALKEMKIVAGKNKYDDKVQMKIDQMSSQAHELMETIKVSEIIKSFDQFSQTPVPDYIGSKDSVTSTNVNDDALTLFESVYNEPYESNQITPQLTGCVYSNPQDHLSITGECLTYTAL